MKIYTLIAAIFAILCPIGLQAQTATRLVGGDISLLPRYEQYNTPYLTADGSPIDDVLLYMRDVCGWNALRVRLFVNPQASEAKDGVVQDLAYVTDLGRRIKDAGMQFLLDFHYSDTWADPVSQKLPAAWSDCKTVDQKAARVYEYTSQSLNTLVEAGACPDYVQVGNEISYGMVDIKVHPYDCNGDDWDGLLHVLTDGCKAVRECCPEAKIIIHTERAAKASDTEFFYSKLSSLDYDIIGLSYYPIWHAPLSTLSGTLSQLEQVFPDKQVQIVETAYNYEWWPNSGVIYDTRSTWPCSVEGQRQFAIDLVEELRSHSNVTGLYWWFPEENGNGGPSWNANTIVINSWLDRGLWNNNDHKALPALYELSAFGQGQQAISNVAADASPSGRGIYSLGGMPVQASWQDLPRGIYLVDGQKWQK